MVLIGSAYCAVNINIKNTVQLCRKLQMIARGNNLKALNLHTQICFNVASLNCRQHTHASHQRIPQRDKEAKKSNIGEVGSLCAC